MTAPTPGIYRHYKGGLYQVISVATHSETLEQMVVYQSMKDGAYWVRPLSMWNDIIEKDGKTMTRFTRILIKNNQSGGKNMSEKYNLTSEQRKRAMTCQSEEELFALAKELHLDVAEEDVRATFQKLHPQNHELSSEELENVVGGGCVTDLFKHKCSECGCMEFFYLYSDVKYHHYRCSECGAETLMDA